MPLSVITPAYAQTQEWKSLGSSIGTNCVDPNSSDNIATLQGFECIFINLLRIIIPLAGIVAFIVLIVGGFQYLTSSGDPKKTQQAQGTIVSAVIGLVVTVAVWFIFRLINVITGINPLQFAIPK